MRVILHVSIIALVLLHAGMIICNILLRKAHLNRLNWISMKKGDSGINYLYQEDKGDIEKKKDFYKVLEGRGAWGEGEKLVRGESYLSDRYSVHGIDEKVEKEVHTSTLTL
jgi:hypothetical protein